MSDWQYIYPWGSLHLQPSIRVRARTSIAYGSAGPCLAAPVLTPGLDTRYLAQDVFATIRNSIGPGEHFSPASDIWGSCAFSNGNDLAAGNDLYLSPNLITGDSISMSATDARGAGGISEVRWYGAITEGPHAGKAPAPYTVGPNGFFEVVPDSVRRPHTGQVIADFWFVDLDDTYFRGGDRMLSFWTAVDASGGRASYPAGITAANFPPTSVAAAELATGGLTEVSYLADHQLGSCVLGSHPGQRPWGSRSDAWRDRELESSATAFSTIASASTNRRSGEANRTSFMYTLDRLGYRGYYDVYDHQGSGTRTTSSAVGPRLRSALDTRSSFKTADELRLDVPAPGWHESGLARRSIRPSGTATTWRRDSRVRPGSRASG